MKTSSCKNKGRLLQQFVAKLIATSFELSPDDVVSRPMGSPSCDIMMSPLAQKRFPISVECKNSKAKPGPDSLEQAKYNCYKDTTPVVAWKPHRAPMDRTLVIMELIDLINLIKRIRVKDETETR